jgi:hypothetical protein
MPKFDEAVLAAFGQASAALEHFQRVMRQHRSALV